MIFMLILQDFLTAEWGPLPPPTPYPENHPRPMDLLDLRKVSPICTDPDYISFDNQLTPPRMPTTIIDYDDDDDDDTLLTLNTSQKEQLSYLARFEPPSSADVSNEDSSSLCFDYMPQDYLEDTPEHIQWFKGPPRTFPGQNRPFDTYREPYTE